LPTPPTRVLVVEDFEPFRRSVVSIVQQQPEYQVIGEASDGVEAVRKAQELQPELVLLDIGLPSLNGMEVARQVGRLCPTSKIIFLSQESSTDIVRAALAIGAKGYVGKTDGTRELLMAVNAVLRGEQFVSSSLAGRDSTHAKDEHTSAHPDRSKLVAPLPPANVPVRHEVALYLDDAAFVRGFARVAHAALKVKNAVILITTTSHASDILDRLNASGVDTDVTLKNGSLTQVDALDALSKLMVNDLPDPGRCAKLVGDLVTRASKAAKRDHPRVAICGECAPTLLAEGNPEGAIRLEHLWDQTTRNYRADTLCGYLWHAFPNHENSPFYARICAEHSAVIGRELGY
jgi:DNA-binding NarL/FixJ family response regulator